MAMDQIAHLKAGMPEQLAAALVHRGRRQAEKLIALRVKTIVKTGKPGRWGDGRNLSLISKTGATHSWEFTYRRGGRSLSIGLGSLQDVSIAQAREKAKECRLQVRAGKDPQRERKAVQMVASKIRVAFCIDQFIGLNASRLSLSTQRAWRPSRLMTAALLAKPIEEATKLDIIEALKVRTRVMKPRVQKKLERFFDWAIVRGYRAEPNPAQLKLADYFELAKHKTKSHPPMPWQVLPEFLQWLRTKEDFPAWCLELQILTCVRPGEARGALWEEIDFDAGLWTIPENRMKMNCQHRVPLSPAALALLRRLYEIRTSPLIFPSVQNGKMCAQAVGNRIPNDRWLTPAGERPHVHGFRGSFTNWSAENKLSFEVTEKCLAHVFGDKTTRAYRTADLLDQRREMLEQWAAFLDGPAL